MRHTALWQMMQSNAIKTFLMQCHNHSKCLMLYYNKPEVSHNSCNLGTRALPDMYTLLPMLQPLNVFLFASS